jgi:hypothetical protein
MKFSVINFNFFFSVLFYAKPINPRINRKIETGREKEKGFYFKYKLSMLIFASFVTIYETK